MASTPFSLDPQSTALVLIDLQRGIVARDTKPYTAAQVVERAARLTKRFREAGALVVLVHVEFAPDFADRLNPPADSPTPAAPLPEGWSEIVPELGSDPRDVIITKRNWARSTARRSTCSSGGGISARSSSAGSRRTWASSRRRAMRSSAATSRCSSRMRAPRSARRCTRSRSRTSSRGLGGEVDRGSARGDRVKGRGLWL